MSWVCTYLISTRVKLNNIAPQQSKFKTVENLSKDLRILSTLKMKQLLQLKYTTKLID